MRHVTSIATVLALAVASQVVAQTTAPPVIATAKPSAQAQYDELVKLVEASDWPKAVPAGEALVARLNGYTKKSLGVIASVKVFLARAYHGAGQRVLALEAVTAALESGGLDGVDQVATRYDASLLAGEISEAMLDLDLASARYDVAASLGATPSEKGRGQIGYIRTIMTIDPAKALAAANALLASLPDDKVNKQIRAAVNSLRARALMNAGQSKEALVVYEAAVKGLGGLTARVDRNDVSARSDAALAAFLVGDQDRAREFMAYTGAGILKGEGFKLGRDMRTPQCGGVDGLTPEDVAVIEFSVGDDGTVSNVTPIYANRSGKVGLTFARAVESWWWDAAEVKKIERFFRSGTRLQMRCTNATDRPEVASLLAGDYQAWLAKIGAKLPVFEGLNGIALLAAIKAENRKLDQISAINADMLPLIDVAISKAGFPFGNQQNAAQAVSLAKALGAPATAMSHLQLRVAQFSSYQAKSSRADQSTVLEAFKALLTDPAYSRDPRSQALLKLSIAAYFQSQKRFGEALIAFREAAALQGLDDRDPIKVAALIQLASAEQGANNSAAATAAFTQSGLSARQCALADAKPPLLDINKGYGAFPSEALQWGFSGWVVTEYDIAASGKTDNVRTLIAYPPYIFTSAASTMIKGAKYRATFRPDGGLSCGASNERISFLSGF